MKRVFWAAILIISAQSDHAAPPVSKADLANSRSPKQEPMDWHLIGNFGTLPGTHFLGTTDSQALELKVNAERALRLEPNERGNANILGGSPLNQIGTGSHASVITG